jgi:hypothetical protein
MAFLRTWTIPDMQALEAGVFPCRSKVLPGVKAAILDDMVAQPAAESVFMPMVYSSVQVVPRRNELPHDHNSLAIASRDEMMSCSF